MVVNGCLWNYFRMVENVNRVKTALMVVGPTAVGKTGFAIRLAQHYNTEVVSADSRQVYREMLIGTAFPTIEELEAAPHHLVGHRSVLDHYNVSMWEKEALETLATLFKRHNVVVVSGGSGMYCKVLEHGIDQLPDIDMALRDALAGEYATKGLTWLQQEVAKVDPEYYEKVDRKNPARLLRALEVYHTTHQKFSELRIAQPVTRPFRFIKIGLDLPREELHKRIAERAHKMVNNGLVDECRKLYPLKNKSALKSVGYTEVFNHFDGQCTLDQAVEKIITNTRRYARRQITWFKRDQQITWFHPDRFADALEHIEKGFITQKINPKKSD